MKQISYRTVLAYAALVLSFFPASFAVFGLLFLGLDLVDEQLYTPAEALQMGALATSSSVLAFLLIRSAARYFSKPPRARAQA